MAKLRMRGPEGAVVRDALKQGWTIKEGQRRKGGGVKLVAPDGQVIFVHSSYQPGSIRLLVKQMEPHGFNPQKGSYA